MEHPRAARGRSRTLGYVAAWTLAATAAVTVGVLAVSSAGSTMRDRGPLGIDTQLVREAETGPVAVDPDAPSRQRTFDGEYGAFVVECRGRLAIGLEVRPAAGWRAVSFEEGPDEDVDVVFAAGARSVELEIYCNAGQPTVGDREVKTLPDGG